MALALADPVTVAAVSLVARASSGAGDLARGGQQRFVDLQLGYGWWVGLLTALVFLLGLDLFLHRGARPPSLRRAAVESAMWVACGLSFALIVLWTHGSGAFGEYLSGYLTEKALSVDNVFVWAILFTSMRIPARHQHRVLFWGVFGALFLRAGFIFAGTTLIHRFEFLLVGLGAFLVWTGARLIRNRNDEGGEETTAGLSLLRRVMPVSPQLDGARFLTRIDGRRAATPLLAALVVVEVTDLVFAVDSVPAIMGLSKEPFLIFSSNAFAILGLRAMYFLLAGARDRFHFLNHALGVILIFVGAKMVVGYFFHVDISVWISLLGIAAVLTVAVVASWRRGRRIETAGPAPSTIDDHGRPLRP